MRRTVPRPVALGSGRSLLKTIRWIVFPATPNGNMQKRIPARRLRLRAFVAKNDSLDRFSGYAEREYAETYPGPSP